MGQVDQASHRIKLVIIIEEPANKSNSVGSEKATFCETGACLTVIVLASTLEPEKEKSSHILMD